MIMKITDMDGSGERPAGEALPSRREVDEIVNVRERNP
jgi:hypothetical protein